MTPERDAVEIGAAMRAAQKKYFAERTQANLIAAKTLEKQFDDICQRIQYSQTPQVVIVLEKSGEGLVTVKCYSRPNVKAKDIIYNYGYFLAGLQRSVEESPEITFKEMRAVKRAKDIENPQMFDE